MIKFLTPLYYEAEDRMLLVGWSPQGESTLVWLTRRLADQLVDDLFERFLEWSRGLAARDDGAVGGYPSFAEAEASIRGRLDAFLALSAEVAAVEGGALRFEVRGPGARRVVFEVDQAHIVAWLHALHAEYVRGGWSLSAWPGPISEWISAGHAAPLTAPH
jgi:hypothetical protein